MTMYSEVYMLISLLKIYKFIQVYSIFHKKITLEDPLKILVIVNALENYEMLKNWRCLDERRLLIKSSNQYRKRTPSYFSLILTLAQKYRGSKIYISMCKKACSFQVQYISQFTLLSQPDNNHNPNNSILCYKNITQCLLYIDEVYWYLLHY